MKLFHSSVARLGAMAVCLCASRSTLADDAAKAVVVARSGQQPQAAIDAQETIHIAFGAGRAIHYCNSTDGGKTYSQPILVAEPSALALGMRRGPRIAATKDAVVITAIAGDVGKGRDGDVVAWTSSDGGRTWRGPAKVNDVTASAREGLHAMAASPQGDLYCVWLDLRNSKSEIFGSRSTDGGLTWSANTLVYHSPSGSVCECCHPSVTFDAAGGLYVMWRNSLAGARDMFVSTSADKGSAFTSAEKLGRGTWPLKACPMDGGYLAVHTSGKIATIWRRDKEIFAAAPGEAERLLGPGEQPWAAATAKGTYLTWITRRPGDLMLLSPGASHAVRVDGNARDPAIAASPGGGVVLVWECGDRGATSVMAQVVADR
jgi:hypothetical protein